MPVAPIYCGFPNFPAAPPPSCLLLLPPLTAVPAIPSPSPKTASSTGPRRRILPPCETQNPSLNSRPYLHLRVPSSRESTGRTEANQAPDARRPGHSLIAPLTRPPSVRLANPVNHVPRNHPVTVSGQAPQGDNQLLESHHDAFPLLTIPEQRRSRLTPSPNSLVVERSQGETDSGRTSIALPRGQRRSDAFDQFHPGQHHYNEMAGPAGAAAKEIENLQPPEPAYLSQDPRARHVPSQLSLRSQGVAALPSNTAQSPAGGGREGGEGTDVAEELAWGPAHPCFPHLNPHVPLGSNEYLTTRIIRIRRDWMIRGDLSPAFSNLYPEILDPLLPEQEFRRVIAHINGELLNAFNPFSVRSWIDSAMGLLTGWFYDDLGGPAIKGHLKRLEAWIDNWNRKVGEKDGVHIWGLRRTAYMSLDIQIPDPKVGIVPSEGGSLPGTRPSSAAR